MHCARLSQRSVYCAALLVAQVLGIMTSLLITSQSKERPFVLLHRQAVFSHSTAGHSSSQFASIELSLSENISHGRCDSSTIIIWQFIQCSEDIFNYSKCDSYDSVRERKIVHRKRSYSECQKAPRKVMIVTILQMRGNHMGNWRQNA
jgi:hypothetical protein